MALSDEEKKELYAKYKIAIDKKFQKNIIEEPSVSYSQSYQQFKAEQVGKLHSLYEKLCNSSEKILKVSASQAETEKLENALRMAHIQATPTGVYSFATLTTLFAIILSLLLGVLLGNLLVMLCGMFAALGLFFYLPSIPQRAYNIWRAKASDQLILSVLYMIIYMEHTPNLELAIWFAARHLPPPLSLDFMKILWDVETKKYATIEESLEEYVEHWRGYDDEFIEAVHLVESSLTRPEKEEQQKTLEKAEEVILEGTTDHMMSFAHNLQSPVETLHMLGIVLPVMGLVMLPMVTAFMGEDVPSSFLFVLYDVVLPILVYLLARSVLAIRPAGANTGDVYQHLEAKYSAPTVDLFGFKLKIPAGFISSLVFAGIATPPVIFCLFNYIFPPEEGFKRWLFSEGALFASLGLILAVGLSLGIYFYLRISHLIKIKRRITEMEKEFASAIFQLGNRIAEGVPVEAAISKIIETMPKASITEMFRVIDYNIKEQGMNLREAIFDPKSGALVFYPSAIIKSCMQTLVESSKKGTKVAASSLITISKYLQNVHRVEERLKDLLADTISSMAMQIKMFAPVISGIVVALGVLTTSILLGLSDELASGAGLGELGGAEGLGGSAGLLSIFQTQYALPGFYFQLMVGIYLIEIVIIMTLLLSGITNGIDRVEEENALGQNLLVSIPFYVGITAACTILFLALIGPTISNLL